MALVHVPVNLDAAGNAIIPGVVRYANREEQFDYSFNAAGPDVTTNWADVSAGVMRYAPNAPYSFNSRVHRFLKKTVPNPNPRRPPIDKPLYEVWVQPGGRMATRGNIVNQLLAHRSQLQYFCTSRQGAYFYFGEQRARFLQQNFPILGVRRADLPNNIQQRITKLHIFPASSRVVRQGLALATFYDEWDALRNRQDENEAAAVSQRKAAQSIWTSIVLPVLMMVQPETQPNRLERNQVDIRLSLVFIVSSDTQDNSLFYFNFPVHHFEIDETNTWLREMQYYFLRRLTQAEIARTDSNRRIESLELVNLTFVRRAGVVPDGVLGGFLPSQVSTSSQSTSSQPTFSVPDENTTFCNRAKETLKQNSYTWGDQRGWYLASYSGVNRNKENVDPAASKTKKMCLYWACLKGIRLIELSHYDIPKRWSASQAPTVGMLIVEVHKHLTTVMKLDDIDDTDGVSYGSPLIQALANVLCVDIRINDCNWNILSHYKPDPALGSDNYLRQWFKQNAANRQLFSVSPICENATIVLCLLEHPSDCMVSGIPYEKVVEDWSAVYSDQDVLNNDTVNIRVPGPSVIPFNDRLHSYWHYWLVVSVQPEVERDMLAQESLSIDYIPWCLKCDKLHSRKPLLGCRLHGPSPANAGDRRRRNFKKVIIEKCHECGMSFYPHDTHVCKRTCPHCYRRVSASGWETHVCFTMGHDKACEKCGLRQRNMSNHVCSENSVSFMNKMVRKNDVLLWKLGKTDEFSNNKYEGYIVWDLETFPSKEQNDRMVVYRCGLYHNSFAAEQMGLEGEYHDFVCTCPTESGFGNVIEQLLLYIAKPFFNNYIAISYFGCVFDHYLLLHDILSNARSSALFRVSQPEYDTYDKSGDDDNRSDRSASSLGSNPATGYHRRTMKKQAREDATKSHWVVKNKKIFSMWLCEPIDDISPRYAIKFVDLGLFTQCSLNQACKDFGLSKEESKDIFPHDFISCWEDLKYEGPVPDKKYFPISVREEASALKWQYEIDGNSWNLLKVSEEYLRKDVMSTRQLFLKFSSTLDDRLKVSLTSSITLPSLAQKVLKLYLDREKKAHRPMEISLPSTPTVGSDFRKSIFGGRVMPMRDKFVSPALEDVEADLVLLRRAYSVVVSQFLDYVVMRVHNIMVGHESLVPETLIPLKRCLSECLSAFKTSAPENIVLLIKSHVDKLDAGAREKFALLMSETIHSMDWNDWVSIQFDRIKAAGCLRAVDVSSLYPHSMAGFEYPIGPYEEATGVVLDSMTDSARFMFENSDFTDFKPSSVEGRISDLRSRDLWPVSGMFYIKYVPNQKLSMPVLPRKELKLLLWDLISSEGWYNSVDIETAIAFGYQVDFVQGYVWNKSAYLFKGVIDDLYKIKQEAEEAGDMTLRSIAKLLMNSMYGKMLQKPVRDSVELLYTDMDLAAFMKRNLWTGFESVGCSDVCVLAFGVTRPNDPNEDGFVEWDENSVTKKDGTTVEWLDGQPIQLGSFILGYSRRVMMLYFAAINPAMKVGDTAFYTDTDSIFLSDEQFKMLDEQGYVREGLGFLADDFKGGIGVEAYFTNPKSYIVTKVKKAKGSSNAEFFSHIKAKGIAKSCLSQTYKMGYMDEGDPWLNIDFDRAFNLLAEASTPLKPANATISTAAVRRGEVGMCCDPELFSMMNEWAAMDPQSDSKESPYIPNELRGQYEEMSWIEQQMDGDEPIVQAPDSGDDDRMLSTHMSGLVFHAQTPDEKREERLERTRSSGKLDKESFMHSRMQFDGRSKRPVSECLSFPTFKRFLGRNRTDVESGATNFSIVPKTICRSFGTRIYLGACYVPDVGVYRPWTNDDVEANGVGNAALARGGAKGEQWAKRFDEEMDKSLFN